MATSATNGNASHQVPLIINGKEVSSPKTFPVTSPGTGESLWTASAASREEAVQAVDAAAAAFPSWSATKPHVRRDIFLKAADILVSRKAELAEYLSHETGAVQAFSDFNLMLTESALKTVAGGISEALVGSIPVCADDGTSALVFKEPYGVVLGIAPWNAPYILGLRAVIYALATGNTAVLKGSELSPRCFWAIGDILKQAGLPDGVLNVIYHSPSDAAAVTTALIEHPAVRKVNFTGSTAVGSIIAAAAGKALKPVLMELGGKASAIVCEDADVDLAAFQCALGAFMHSGQICMSTERILVHHSLVEPFRAAFQKATSTVFSNDQPAPILIASAGVDKNKKLLSDATSKGAKVVHGDPNAKEANAHLMRPIIVSDVTPEMDLYHTESFGPSVSLYSVTDDDEAVRIANDTDYGLSGAVFTRDLTRGLRIAKQIDSGAIHINSMSVHDEATLPHGGVKKSGWGRFNGSWGFEEFLKLKTVTFPL